MRDPDGFELAPGHDQFAAGMKPMPAKPNAAAVAAVFAAAEPEYRVSPGQNNPRRSGAVDRRHVLLRTTAFGGRLTAYVRYGDSEMSSAVAVQNGKDSSIMHDVIVKGDLSKLSDDQRARYYAEVCASINVNPLTKPFEFIELNRKLDALRDEDVTDQLRTVRGVSIFRVDAETTPDGLRM